MRDQEQITDWDRAGKVIETRRGEITYWQYCIREADRLRKAGGSARVLRRTVQKEGYPRHEVCVEGGEKQR